LLPLPPTPLKIHFTFFSIALFVHFILVGHHPKISSELFLISSLWFDQIAHLLVMVFHCYCRRPMRVPFLISLLV
jgi:hypothetical protein